MSHGEGHNFVIIHPIHDWNALNAIKIRGSILY